MRNPICGVSIFLLAYVVSLAHAADVNLRVITYGEVQPGVYGRVEIGNAPPPPVLYAEPVVVVQQTRPVAVVPIYLHVPPGDAKKWSKHCHKYNACGQPVYFVKSKEYDPGYKPKKKKGKKDQ